MLVKKVEIVPIEVIIRNVAAGSLCRLLNLEEGMKLKCPILDFCYKEDSLNDPLISEYHIRAFDWATDEEVEQMKEYVFKINDLMKKFFLAVNLDLIDFKVEFGRFKGKLILADEISPDTCRLWEVGTGKRLDKDRFRKDLGNVEEAYQEVLDRVAK